MFLFNVYKRFFIFVTFFNVFFILGGTFFSSMREVLYRLLATIYHWLLDDRFSRFDTIPACDRRTDWLTDGIAIVLCIAVLCRSATKARTDGQTDRIALACIRRFGIASRGPNVLSCSLRDISNNVLSGTSGNEYCTDKLHSNLLLLKCVCWDIIRMKFYLAGL